MMWSYFISLVQGFDQQQAMSSFLILFAVIDVVGNIPLIVNVQKQVGPISARKATLAMGTLMLGFLLVGPTLLHLFQIDVDAFATAGSVVLFILGLEMILDVAIFNPGDVGAREASVVPLAFPILSGTGTLATVLTLKSNFNDLNIVVGILGNVGLVYVALLYTRHIERMLGPVGMNIVIKIMGVIVLAIAFKLFRTHLLLTI